MPFASAPTYSHRCMRACINTYLSIHAAMQLACVPASYDWNRDVSDPEAKAAKQPSLARAVRLIGPDEERNISRLKS